MIPPTRFAHPQGAALADRRSRIGGATGRVYLVGAGPGAADLLTLRAAALLARADVVFHDALVGADVLALAPRARLVAVGKRCGRLSTAQRFINRQLVDAARRHACVVRLKGGDPMLFGRAQEEIAALAQAGIACEIVPGVSAVFGASAALGASLTRRGLSRSVLFLTPAVGEGQAPHDWAQGVAQAGTLVLYMAGRQAAAISAGLQQAGIPAGRPAVLVENATLPDQRVLATTVAGLPRAAQGLGAGPVLVLVGEVYAELLAQAADGAGVSARFRAA